MTDKPISPLRQRMIDDMTARRIKEKVQKDYVRHVRTFAAFLGRSPDTATSEDPGGRPKSLMEARRIRKAHVIGRRRRILSRQRPAHLNQGHIRRLSPKT